MSNTSPVLGDGTTLPTDLDEMWPNVVFAVIESSDVASGMVNLVLAYPRLFSNPQLIDWMTQALTHYAALQSASSLTAAPDPVADIEAARLLMR